MKMNIRNKCWSLNFTKKKDGKQQCDDWRNSAHRK